MSIESVKAMERIITHPKYKEVVGKVFELVKITPREWPRSDLFMSSTATVIVEMIDAGIIKFVDQ